MKQILGFGGGAIAGAAAIVLAQAPAQAFTVVRDVQLVQGSNGEINLVLVTEGTERPEVFVIRRGNDFVADIINTQLNSPNGSFQQNNPAPGISSIMVSQLDPTSVRVIVTGSNGSPDARIIQGATDGIAIAIAPGAVAQAPATPPPVPDSPNVMVPDPDVNIGGRPAVPSQTGGEEILMPDPNLTPQQPGQAPLQPRRDPNPAPPFLPRAVAPPLGDIAVSNVNPAVSNINLNSNEVIPRLVLRDASVREVLSLLARVAGLNVAFSNLEREERTGRLLPSEQEELTISLDIENEPVQEVFNYVIRLTGLKANRVGNTIFVGPELPESAQDIVMRTLRLNQVAAEDAAAFLSTQGAETQIRVEELRIEEVGTGINRRFVEVRRPEIVALGAKEGRGALLLRGLSISPDSRLNSVTIVGPPEKVEIATALLMQLDLRLRQVAVNVKVIDINLSGEATQNSSFSFGINDTFFVNDGGAAAVNFGGFNPPGRDLSTGGINSRPIIENRTSDGILLDSADPFFDRDGTTSTPLTAPGGGIGLRPVSPVTDRPGQVGISEYTPFTRNLNTGELTGLGSVEFAQFPFFQYPRRFLSTLQAQIVSGNAKILTDPTLVVQEGETATVNLVENIVKAIEVETVNTVAGPQVNRDPTFEDIGLTVSVNVERVDDNGFVSLRINPEVSAVGERINTDDQGGFATETLIRRLDSGLVRLRDGQTLILSGIIQERERQAVSKIPLLGDLPLIGALFRSTTSENERAEVVVLVTPNILDDSDRSPYGYQYNVSPDAQRMIQGR